MPATPAWPPKSLPRLFVRAALAEGAMVELDAAQANYLGNVLRMGAGAQLLVFDGSSKTVRQPARPNASVKVNRPWSNSWS